MYICEIYQSLKYLILTSLVNYFNNNVYFIYSIVMGTLSGYSIQVSSVGDQSLEGKFMISLDQVNNTIFTKVSRNYLYDIIINFSITRGRGMTDHREVCMWFPRQTSLCHNIRGCKIMHDSVILV